MRGLFILLFLFTTVTAWTQTKGVVPSDYDHTDYTDHFVLLWNDGETKATEIDEAKIFAEEAYAKIAKVFGVTNMPGEQLIITFRGEGVDKKTRRKRTPHVDYQGRIHLYRFDQGGYLSVLPHEMVHAIRINKVARWERFFEEGLASAIAYHLYPDKAGFPRFGYSLDLIAGYWLTSGKGIPLETMRSDHSRLNLKCQLQTYVAREDFFNYLNSKYGTDKLVEFAYTNQVGTLEQYKSTWGKTFNQLIVEWEADLRKRYGKIENPQGQIDEYFSTTSARYIPVCEAGIDY